MSCVKGFNLRTQEEELERREAMIEGGQENWSGLGLRGKRERQERWRAGGFDD